MRRPFDRRYCSKMRAWKQSRVIAGRAEDHGRVSQRAAGRPVTTAKS
jgi:hypothetical protein